MDDILDLSAGQRDQFLYRDDRASGSEGFASQQRTMRIVFVAATVMLSWLLTHVVFAIRYAHEWYDSDDTSALRRGLNFPGCTEPDYMDFLYFAMVLGMTFQVSDVQIEVPASARARHAARAGQFSLQHHHCRPYRQYRRWAVIGRLVLGAAEPVGLVTLYPDTLHQRPRTTRGHVPRQPRPAPNPAKAQFIRSSRENSMDYKQPDLIRRRMVSGLSSAAVAALGVGAAVPSQAQPVSSAVYNSMGEEKLSDPVIRVSATPISSPTTAGSTRPREPDESAARSWGKELQGIGPAGGPQGADNRR